MRGATSVLAVGLLVMMAAGCTPGVTHCAASTAPRTTSVTTVATAQAQVSARRFSAAKCHPPSPAMPWHPPGGGQG